MITGSLIALVCLTLAAMFLPGVLPLPPRSNASQRTTLPPFAQRDRIRFAQAKQKRDSL